MSNGKNDPSNPPIKAKSNTGIVLGRSRSKNSFSPPPPRLRLPPKQPVPNTPVTTTPNVPTTPVPPKPVDSFEGVRTLFAQLRGGLSPLCDPSSGNPVAITTALNKILTDADLLLKNATTAEMYAEALKKLNEGVPFKSNIEGFVKERKRGLEETTKIDNLSQVKHKAVDPLNSKYKLAISQIEQGYLQAKDSESIGKLTLLFKRSNDGFPPQITKANDSIQQSYSVIEKAQSLLGKWIDFAFVDLTAPMDKLTKASVDFQNAATAEAAAEAVKPLLEMEKDISLAEKTAAPALSAYEKYLDQKRKLLDEIHKASILRGGTTDKEMLKLIGEAKTAIVTGDSDVKKAKNADEVDKARKTLAEKSGFLSSCEKISKELKEKAEKDLEALPKYQKLYSELRQARSQMAQLPGAAKVLLEADKLLALHKITSSGEPQSGYAEAVKELKGKPSELLELAKKTSKEFLERELPEDLKLTLDAVEKKLILFEKYVPAYRLEGKRYEIASALNEEDFEEARKKLVEIGNQLDSDTRLGESLRGQCQDALKKVHGDVESMKTNKPAPIYLPFENQIAQEILPAMQAKEFASALNSLNLLDKKIVQTNKDFTDLSNKWKDTEKKLTECVNFCKLSLNWFPLAGRSQDLKDLSTTLIDTMNKTHSYEEGLKEGADILLRFDRMKKELAQNNLNDTTLLDTYSKKKAECREKLEKARQETLELLKRLEGKLIENKITSVKSTPAHALYDKTWKAWEEIVLSSKATDTKDPTGQLTKQYDQTVNDLTAVRKLCSDALSDPSVMKGIVDDASKVDLVAKTDRLVTELKRMLTELESIGIDTKAHRSALANQPPAQATQENLKVLAEEGKKIQTLYSDTREKNAKECQLKINEVETMKKGLVKLRQQFYKFEDYFKEYEYQLLDMQAMFNSPDLSLRAYAEEQLKVIRATLSEATSKNQNGATFTAVIKKWEEQVARLGKDELVKKRMPVTFENLSSEIQKAMVQAKSLPPAESMLLLVPFDEKIDKAVLEATALKQELEKFEAKVEGVKEKMTEVKKFTSTRIMDKAEAYWKLVNTKIEKATEYTETEGKMPDAFIELDKLEKELDEMLKLSPNEARESLQEKDTQASQQQRTLRDMIRQWEQDSTAFTEKILPGVRQSIEKAKGDTKQADNLEKSLAFQNKLLEPYLYILSKLPHRSNSVNPAPDFEKAIQAFADAQKQLDAFRKTADRLMNNPEGTNVSYESDLKKIRQDWSDRVVRMRKAVETFALAVEKVPKEMGTDSQKPETFVPTDTAKLVGPAATQLAKSLRTMANRIKPEAFDEPINILVSKEATESQKLKAREDALRSMRLMKSELVDNPLVKGIFKAEGQPLVDVRGEIGTVRAGLKKVEIAIIVAV